MPLLLVIARARSPRADSHGLLDASAGPALVCVGRLTWSGRERARAPRPTTGRSGSGCSGPSALLKPETLKLVGWFLLVRAFTPLGAGLAMIGLGAVHRGAHSRGASRSRLWLVWGISALVAMAFLAEKLHHEYYWLLLAPVAAVGIGRCLALAGAESPRGWRSPLAAIARLALAGSGPLDLADARRMEWARGGGRAPSAATVPADAWVVAPEALLFQADRRGCRMEWSDAAAARAAGEWEAGRRGRQARSNWSNTIAARGLAISPTWAAATADPRRKGLHDAVRRRYKVIVDRPDVIIADLADSEMHWNAN